MCVDETRLIGNRIRSLLEERECTQQALADGLGVSKQVMHKIINGKKVMTISELARIAPFFDVSTDMLLAPLTEPQKIEGPIFAQRGVAIDEEAKRKIEVLRTVISEIHLSEDLLND
jgi:transcriptional regulator with XRE-family HTH domain